MNEEQRAEIVRKVLALIPELEAALDRAAEHSARVRDSMRMTPELWNFLITI